MRRMDADTEYPSTCEDISHIRTSINVSSKPIRSDIDCDCICPCRPQSKVLHEPPPCNAHISCPLESGIGSSVSSIDVICGVGCNALGSSSNVDSELSFPSNQSGHCLRHDCHDLPPVTEEEDSDCLINALSVVSDENKHLEQLPWHDSNISCANCKINEVQQKPMSDVGHLISKLNDLRFCQKLCDHAKQTHDDSCAFLWPLENYHCHIEKPWLSASGGLIKPVLSKCYESRQALIKSEFCSSRNHFVHVMSTGDKNSCQSTFRRHSLHNPSILSCNVRSHLSGESRPNIFEEDEVDNHIVSRASERVLEWLKLTCDLNADDICDSHDSNCCERTVSCLLDEN